MECPSEDYLDSFVSHPAFVRHQAPTENTDDSPCCVIHFTPQKIMDNPRYVDWINKFGLNTRHIVVNEENQCLGTEAVHRHQHKLHMLHSEIFPFLNEESFDKKTRVRKSDRTSFISEVFPRLECKFLFFKAEDLAVVHRPRTHYTIHLQPELKFDAANEVSLHPKEYINEVFENDGFLDALAELQTNINARTKNFSCRNSYPKIVMLGTGSSIPSKVRNTSGILLRVDESHSMVLDCGEGTYGQIARIFGKSETGNVMRTIKVIHFPVL